MSFYVTLPSNSSMDYFPNNTATNFSTQLKRSMNFDFPYEVALVEIHYNHSWHNYLGELIYNHRNEAHVIHLNSNEGDSFQNFVDNVNSKLEEIYLQIETLYMRDNNLNNNLSYQELKTIIKDRPDFPKFIYEKNRLIFNCHVNSFFQFHGLIAGLLFLKEYDKIYLSQPPIPIRENIFSLTQAIYVYTDIIDFQYVGDSFSPLLQTVITENKNYASMVSVTYENPHYIPVNKSLITSINIDLRDDLGNKILFQDGKTILKLHFRPKRYGH